MYGGFDNIKSVGKGLWCEGVNWNWVTAQRLQVLSCAHCREFSDRTEGRQLVCQLSDYGLAKNNYIPQS
jgi:hypothetical protein